MTSSFRPGGSAGDGDQSPDYDPKTDNYHPPEMDVKPSMGRVSGLKGVEGEYPGREFPSNGDYLPTTTSQQWQYNHQQMLSLPSVPGTNSYLGHADNVRQGGYQLNNGREVASEEFRETQEEGNDGMEGMKARQQEEIGHYDNDIISHTGPIRGYSRADAFVWRPY